jgi:hypothetical protein
VAPFGITVLAAEKPPLRLPLDNDAADAILDHLDNVRRELLAWEGLSRSTDLGVALLEGCHAAWRMMLLA